MYKMPVIINRNITSESDILYSRNKNNWWILNLLNSWENVIPQIELDNSYKNKDMLIENEAKI